MSGLLVLATLGLMALPTITRRWGQRLQPLEWVRINAVSVLGGALMLELALLLCARPALSRSPYLGEWIASAQPRHFFPGGPWAGWLSLGAAILLPAGAAIGLLQARRHRLTMRAGPSLGAHLLRDDYELVVLPTDELVAVAVPGKPAQVIVSAAVESVLTPIQFRAVVEHEAAHLRGGHSRYLLLAAAVERAYWFFPIVRSSLMTLRVALECAADHAATPTNQDRDAIRGALLKLSDTGGRLSVAAFGAPDAVLVRLRSLDRPVAARLELRVFLYTSVLVMAFVAIGVLGMWVRAS